MAGETPRKCRCQSPCEGLRMEKSTHFWGTTMHVGGNWKKLQEGGGGSLAMREEGSSDSCMERCRIWKEVEDT